MGATRSTGWSQGLPEYLQGVPDPLLRDPHSVEGLGVGKVDGRPRHEPVQDGVKGAPGPAPETRLGTVTVPLDQRRQVAGLALEVPFDGPLVGLYEWFLGPLAPPADAVDGYREPGGRPTGDGES